MQNQINNQFSSQQVYPQQQVNVPPQQVYPQGQTAGQYYQNAVLQQSSPSFSQAAQQSYVIKIKKTRSYSLAALICTILSGSFLLISVIMTIYSTGEVYDSQRSHTKNVYERIDETKNAYGTKEYNKKRDDLDERRKNSNLKISDGWEIVYFFTQLRGLFDTLFLVSAIWLIASKKRQSADK